MNIVLSAAEARVLGSLIEKQVTTPEYYPLSLNALIYASNQKSNRDPVMDLDGKTVLLALDRLRQNKLVSKGRTAGSRVIKYAHKIKSVFEFTPQELGTLCILLLRGLQTPGEIRSRTARLCEFGSLEEVGETLRQLMEREDGPFVARLPRQTGRKERRYAHLFCGKVKADEEDAAPPREVEAAAVRSGEERIAELERKVVAMRTELEELKQRFIKLTGGS